MSQLIKLWRLQSAHPTYQDMTIGWYWIEPERRGRGKVGITGADMTMYPNPFNTETNIEFSTLETTNVNVSVYSVDGKLVNILFDGEAEAGLTYNVPFKGTSLPQGMYLVKLVTNTGTVKVEKLILQR